MRAQTLVQGPPRTGRDPMGAVPALADFRQRPPSARQHCTHSGPQSWTRGPVTGSRQRLIARTHTGTGHFPETRAGPGLILGMDRGGQGALCHIPPPPSSPQVPGQAVLGGEHLRGGDVREAQGPDPEAGADVQAEPGGDGLGAPRSPAGHRGVPVPVPEPALELLHARLPACLRQSGDAR